MRERERRTPDQGAPGRGQIFADDNAKLAQSKTEASPNCRAGRLGGSGWLKLALESLRAGERRPGQAFAVAGPKDCGKSLLQKLITELLGGRMASPYQYMTGTTPFNGEMFRAEHLVIEDNAASTDIRARRSFGALLKTITVNDHQPCFAKGKQAVSLTPFWRLAASASGLTGS